MSRSFITPIRCAVLTGAFMLTLTVPGVYAQDSDAGEHTRGARDRSERQERQGRQRGQGDQRQRSTQSPMPLKQAQAVWAAQARLVASTVEGTNASALSDLYVKARSEHRAAAEAARKAQRSDKNGDADNGGRRRGRGRNQDNSASRELIKQQREAFTTAATAMLSGAGGEKAAKLLGRFDSRWDTMVNTVLGFKLDSTRTNTALTAIHTYVASGSAASTNPRERGDVERSSARRARESSQKALQTALSGVLTEEQMTQFTASTSRRNRQRGGMAERLAALDTNGDGKIQFDEVPERMEQMFERLDTNGDDVIDADEMKAAGEGRGGRGRGGQRRGEL